jgi:hypothetical protein
VNEPLPHDADPPVDFPGDVMLSELVTTLESAAPISHRDRQRLLTCLHVLLDVHEQAEVDGSELDGLPPSMCVRRAVVHAMLGITDEIDDRVIADLVLYVGRIARAERQRRANAAFTPPPTTGAT